MEELMLNPLLALVEDLASASGARYIFILI